jgi:uncharacterized membrane protein
MTLSRTAPEAGPGTRRRTHTMNACLCVLSGLLLLTLSAVVVSLGLLITGSIMLATGITWIAVIRHAQRR